MADSNKRKTRTLEGQARGDAHDFMLFLFQTKAARVQAAFVVSWESFGRIDGMWQGMKLKNELGLDRLGSYCRAPAG